MEAYRALGFHSMKIALRKEASGWSQPASAKVIAKIHRMLKLNSDMKA